jgi:alpha-beta hydrolase superfamily lysophospholipase
MRHISKKSLNKYFIIEKYRAMNQKDTIWKLLQDYLPQNCRIDGNTFPEEKYINYGTSSVHLDVYKPKILKNNTVVIILHGVGGNGRLLSFMAVPLVKHGFSVICPDLPGYGFTNYNGIITYQSWVDIGSHIVKHETEQGNTVFLIGLSAGGMLAYNIACINNISGLIVTNILDNRRQEVINYSAKNKFIGRYGIKIMNKMPFFIKKIKMPIKMVSNMNAIVNNKNVLKLLLQDKRGAGNKITLHFLFTMMNYEPLLEAEQYNKSPILLAHPGNDKWTPLHISELFFDKINSKKYKIILENAGHFPIEEPGISQLINGVIDFINKKSSNDT